MMNRKLLCQEHGYRNGHQLLSGTLKLPRSDQDLVDRLSDMAGPLRPGETFEPYLTCYPLGSGTHYVVARTWQDKVAPRAGCVLTRSIFVPMAEWIDSRSLGPYVDTASTLERSDFQPSPTAPFQIPAIAAASLVELVEALVLESRQPVVLFDLKDAEIVALRLLTALWPSARREFAVCSFALSPRKAGGRDFDLLFAPKSARTRFSEWSGRKIDAGGSQAARHRWSPMLASQIFEADSPDLSSVDALGVIRAGGALDGAAIRLSMLWNELAGRAHDAPLAVLGMIDILKTLPSEQQDFGLIAPRLKLAARVASEALIKDDAWTFWSTMLKKLEPSSQLSELFVDVQPSLTSLAERDPAGSVEFLEAEVPNEPIYTPLAVAVADGAAAHIEHCESLLRISPAVTTRMLNASERFAHAMIDATNSDPEEWVPVLRLALQSIDPAATMDVRLLIALNIDTVAQVPLIAPLLSHAEDSLLLELAKHVGKHTRFAYPELNRALIESTRKSDQHTPILQIFADLAGPDIRSSLLRQLLTPDRESISWLLAGTIEQPIARSLLVDILGQASDSILVMLLSDPPQRQKTIQVMMSDADTSADVLVRVLRLPILPIEDAAQAAHALLPHLSGQARRYFSDFLLGRILESSRPDDPVANAIIAKLARDFEIRRLVSHALSPRADTARLSANILILEQLPSKQRTKVLEHIDEITRRLVGQSADYGGAAFAAWGKMIIDSGRLNRDIQLRSAIQALAYALQSLNAPASSLVVAAFPPVYSQLLKSREDEDLSLIQALILLPLTMFSDWDRGKSARSDLIDAFLRSSWPPSDLLVTAVNAKIDQKILKRMMRRSDGAAYLRKIEQDIEKRPPEARRKIANVIAKFKSGKHPEDWD